MTALRLKPNLRLLFLAAVATLVVAPLPAEAFGLGEAELRSYLGQPLRIRVPVIADSVDEVGCVVVKARSDELPAPRNVRSDVITQAGKVVLELRSQGPVDELMLSLLVTAGCTNAVTREYTLFLDPPAAITLPEPSSESAPASAPVASSASSTANRDQLASSGAEAPASPVRPRPPRRRVPAPPAAIPSRDLTGAVPPAPAVASAEATPSAPAAPRRVVSPPPTPAEPSTARQNADRLVLMHDIEEPSLSMAQQVTPPEASGSPDEERMRQIQREQARLVAVLTNHDPDLVPSEREVALQKQLAELSTNLENLSRQVNEVSARNRALEASRVSRTWTWILAAVALLALSTATWLWWRYRGLQQRVSDTPWWEQAKLAAASAFSEHADFDHDHGPASTEGVEVVEVMPNTVPRPVATGTASEPLGAPVAPEPTTTHASPPPDPSPPSAVGRQSVPSLTQYRPPSVALWPSAESDTGREREGEGQTNSYIPFGLVSVTGSIDEQVNPEAIPVKLDFELDLPAPGATVIKDPGATGAAHARAAAEVAAALAPLNLDSSVTAPRTTARSTAVPSAKTSSGEAAPGAAPASPAASPGPAPLGTALTESFETTEVGARDAPEPSEPAEPEELGEPPLGGDAILSNDDVLATMPLTGIHSETGAAGQQFRLVQFASVLEQIDEMEKNIEPAKAIALLRQYVLRDEAIPTLFWLLLFKFYKQINKKAVYEALAEHFSRRYRRPMAGWDEELAARVAQRTLKELPGLEERVKAGWGTAAGVETLRTLLCDRDQADAIVFNAQVQRDLLQMAKVFPFDEAT